VSSLMRFWLGACELLPGRAPFFEEGYGFLVLLRAI